MQFIRLWLRILLLLPWTVLVSAARLAVWPTALLSERFDRRMRRSLIRCWARGFARVSGVQVSVTGTPPEPPFFLVCNHLSYIDMLVIGHQTGCIFVSRGDVEHWPVLGFVAKSLYIIFIDREKKSDTVRVNGLIAETLKMGDALAIFPESRISRGLDVAPFKSSLIEPAVSNGIPIHYATVTYRTPADAPPANVVVGWWRPESFTYHLLRLLRQRGFTALVHFGGEPMTGGDRKELALRLHRAVRKNFLPLR